MRAVVIAGKDAINVHLISVKTGLVDKEPCMILPKELTNDQINEKIVAAGHRWPLYEEGDRCQFCGGPRPCLRED